MHFILHGQRTDVDEDSNPFETGRLAAVLKRSGKRVLCWVARAEWMRGR